MKLDEVEMAVTEENTAHYRQVLYQWYGLKCPEIIPEYRRLLVSYESDRYALHHVLGCLVNVSTHSDHKMIKETISLLGSFEDLTIGLYVAQNASRISSGNIKFNRKMNKFYGSAELLELLQERAENQVATILFEMTNMAVRSGSTEVTYDITQFLTESGGNSVSDMLRAVSGFYSVTKNKKLTHELMQRYRTGQRIADESWLVASGADIDPSSSNKVILYVQDWLRKRKIRSKVRDYWDCCDMLDGFEPFVYKELALCIGTDIVRTVKKERKFLKQQTSSTVIPLAAMMSELDKPRRLQLKELSCMDDLAKAYSIAKANIDETTKKNYLPQFYAGLTECIEQRPEDVGKWAASIVSDFREKGEKGLLRGVVG